jgi:hypothetical protein
MGGNFCNQVAKSIFLNGFPTVNITMASTSYHTMLHDRGENQEQERASAEASGMRRRGPPPVWRNSPAKSLLTKLLWDESSWIHQSTCIEEVYEAEPLFKLYPLKNFKTNFKNLKVSIQEEKDAIRFDQVAFESESELFPRNPTTKAGNPFWDRHEAQRLMAEDVKAGRTLQMKPSVLRESRSEYQEFPLAILRNHKYQEERKEREGVYWQKKRNDRARKKHERDVRSLQAGGTTSLDEAAGNTTSPGRVS